MKKDITIGYPCYDGKAETQSLQTIFQCMNHPDSHVAGIQYLNGDSLISRARNKIAKYFLDTDKKYLLFIDNDIIFQPADIEQLRSHDKPIVGGVYFKKKIPYEPVANTCLAIEGDLHEMAEIGTGFMMIRRDVFEQIIEMHPELAYRNENDEVKGTYYDFFRVGVNPHGRYLSEDYFFCELARSCGFKVYLDTSVIVQHKGHAIYPFDDTTFLKASADLLMKYNTAVEMDESLLQDIHEAVKHQAEARGWKLP